MEWLITTDARTDLRTLEAKLNEWGFARTEVPPIPLGHDEQVIEVSGTGDLPKLAQRAGLSLRISPSSRMTLY